uniref:UPAR/Ly6 domain-containing protein qvr n=1 Tax=Arion vulgaris TaxID=1028688 RepID=A0A0B6Y2L5_9EUPU
MALYGVVSPISIIILACISRGLAIQCYQCDSNEDHTCPSGYGFDKTVNAMLDCNGFEADVPGQFCVKIYQESPGWGGWQKTTRRCGSRTSFGVAWGCRWSWDYTGVFMETCYCEDSDGCNSSRHMTSSIVLLSISLLSSLYLLVSYL